MCVEGCVRGGMSWVYMYIHKGTCDSLDFIKGGDECFHECTSMAVVLAL